MIQRSRETLHMSAQSEMTFTFQSRYSTELPRHGLNRVLSLRLALYDQPPYSCSAERRRKWKVPCFHPSHPSLLHVAAMLSWGGWDGGQRQDIPSETKQETNLCCSKINVCLFQAFVPLVSGKTHGLGTKAAHVLRGWLQLVLCTNWVFSDHFLFFDLLSLLCRLAVEFQWWDNHYTQLFRVIITASSHFSSHEGK